MFQLFLKYEDILLTSGFLDRCGCHGSGCRGDGRLTGSVDSLAHLKLDCLESVEIVDCEDIGIRRGNNLEGLHSVLLDNWFGGVEANADSKTCDGWAPVLQSVGISVIRRNRLAR